MNVDIRMSDYSTFSRRGTGLNLPIRSRVEKDGPIHLFVDSTGPKIFGEGEWLENKHKTRRKPHLGLDLVSGDIVCSDLTIDDVGDPTALPELLDQIDGDVTRFIADGAYDGDPTSALLAERFGTVVEIIIPPPKTSVLSPDADENPTLRDQRITAIATRGRMAWQVSSGYNQRSRGETLIGRWKAIIGPKLKARSFPNQTLICATRPINTPRYLALCNAVQSAPAQSPRIIGRIFTGTLAANMNPTLECTFSVQSSIC
jgi:hypothetical protein